MEVERVFVLAVVQRSHPALILVVVQVRPLVVPKNVLGFDASVDRRESRAPVADGKRPFVVDGGRFVEARKRTTIALLPVRDGGLHGFDGLRVRADAQVRRQVRSVPKVVIHAVVDLRLVQDEVTVVVAPVLDRVVSGVIELLDSPMEVIAPIVGHVEFDGNGALDLHPHIHIRTDVFIYVRESTCHSHAVPAQLSAPSFPTRLCFRRPHRKPCAP